jgi:hypothetical protein
MKKKKSKRKEPKTLPPIRKGKQIFHKEVENEHKN